MGCTIRRIPATARGPWHNRELTPARKAERQDCSAETKNPEMHQHNAECGWKGGAMWRAYGRMSLYPSEEEQR
jgi:hypothetical protein